MENYISVEFEIVEFFAEDIVTASQCIGADCPNDTFNCPNDYD